MAADASDYPTSADSIPRTSPSDNLTGHSDLHDKMADAIEEIQGFVGVSGDTTAGTVVKRVTDLENKDITVTFGTGSDLDGSFTITNLGNVTNTTVAVRDDSHNHIISNVDGLQDALNEKLNSTSYTANDVLTKIKTVDGASSGLDADLLDGQHASAFQPAGNYQPAGTYLVPQGRARTITGCSLSGNSYTNASLILQSSGAGDGDTGSGVSIAFYHTWAGQSWAPQFRAAAEYIYLRDGSNGDTNKFDVNTVHYRNLTQTSSRTRKENIVDYDGATAVIDQLRPVTYNYIEGDGSTKIGLIAEEVQEVLPIAITEVGETPSLDIGTILGLAIAGLKEANARITALEARIAELEG